MMEIRVGQVWQENKYNRRVMHVTELVKHHASRALVAVKLTLIRGTGRPSTMTRPDVLRLGWTFLSDGPAPPRQITLPLAKDTTDTECGSCPTITEREQCGAFEQKDLDHNSEAIFLRLPSCIAAEVK